MGVLEIIIGCAIIVIGILSIIGTYSTYVKYALNHDKKVQATYLLQGGIEAVNLLRDTSWTNYIAPLSATTSLFWNGTSWRVSSTTNEYIDNYTFVRNIKADTVYRDGNGQIASSGTADSSTKLITVMVSYSQNNSTTTETLSKYLVNIYGN